MKENSREEDIECIQEFLEYSQDMINDMDYERPVDVTIYQNQINSLEHILSDYKRVLKENEELKERWDKDTHKLQNDLDIANAKIIELKKEKEKLNKYTIHLTDEQYRKVIELAQNDIKQQEKQKIKDKIEEIKNRIDKYREYTELGIETDVEWVDNVADRQTLKTLQDLLEEKGE